ncbi:MAG: hypothetical protein SchgKO_10630 [Schleiferiaceae bacterium]
MNKDARPILQIITLLAVNLILASWFGATSFLFLTPVCMGAAAAILLDKVSFSGMLKKPLTLVLLLTVNDLGIRQFSAGTYDQLGQFFVQASLVGAVALVLLIWGIKIFTRSPFSKEEFLYVILFLVLMILEIFAFHNLGPDWRFHEMNSGWF